MKQGLSWTGGPDEVDLRPPAGADPEATAAARAELEAFRSDCHEQYMVFALNVELRGHIPKSKRWQFLWDRERSDVLLSVGTGPPATEDVPGSRTFAAMRQGKFLDAVLKGGDFGCRDANAFIVFVYSLWERRCRREIARLFNVESNDVRCPLMGDLRSVRNAILHAGWRVRKEDRTKMEVLPLFWGEIPEDELRISAHMVNLLMEQINALRVEIQ